MKDWINIEEHLPVEIGEYLVTDGKIIGIATYVIPSDPIEKFYPYWWNAPKEFAPWGNNITHWMPMPKLPSKKVAYVVIASR